MLNFNDGSCTEAYKAKLPLNLDNVPFLFLSKKKTKQTRKLYARALISAKQGFSISMCKYQELK